MKIWIHANIIPEIEEIFFCDTVDRDIIQAAITSKDITKNLIRVKSSNVWAFNINMKSRKDKTGDVYVQFKSKYGGPGDIYVLYDVPFVIYRKWISAPSKGHFYWKYLRNNFMYSKLTGDKKGKLKNAIN